jgi:cytochrome c556
LQSRPANTNNSRAILTKPTAPRRKGIVAEKTTAFAEAATALDGASQAKDLAAAKAAQDSLSNACMQCHNEHKRKGKGG